MRYSKEESKMIWDQNAEFWDYTMGDESNDFHRNVVRPKVTELLNPNSSDYILEKTLPTLIQPSVSFENGRKWTQISDSFENGRIFAQ